MKYLITYCSLNTSIHTANEVLKLHTTNEILKLHTTNEVPNYIRLMKYLITHG